MKLNKEIAEFYQALIDMKKDEDAIKNILYDENLSAREKIEQIKAIATLEKVTEREIILEKGKMIQKAFEEK